jgi:uncharacterized protein
LALVIVGELQAQELRCTQIFMNASEKRICGTPSLMQLDQQLGEVGRRAAMHQDSFKSDQRAFRKALKACKGDEACLTVSYKNRIAELQSFVDTLAPPDAQEVAKLDQAAEKTQEKRDAQADTRAEIAENLEAKDEAVVVASEVLDTYETPVVDALQEELVQPEPIAAAAPVEQSVPAAKSEEMGWGGFALISALILGALAIFKAWLNEAVRRCPGCKKWYAGKLIDQDREAYTDYATKTFVDEHRNRMNELTGRTTKQRQVKVRVVETTNYFQCIHCNCNWALTSKSRSS